MMLSVYSLKLSCCNCWYHHRSLPFSEYLSHWQQTPIGTVFIHLSRFPSYFLNDSLVFIPSPRMTDNAARIAQFSPNCFRTILLSRHSVLPFIIISFWILTNVLRIMACFSPVEARKRDNAFHFSGLVIMEPACPKLIWQLTARVFVGYDLFWCDRSRMLSTSVGPLIVRDSKPYLHIIRALENHSNTLIHTHRHIFL